MIQLPDIPIIPISITSTPNNLEPWIQEILNKRLTIFTNFNNYSNFINNLEDYLNFIFVKVMEYGNIDNYNDVFEQTNGIIISDSIPWNLPITKIKKQDQFQWNLQNELIILMINLSQLYNLKSGEIIKLIMDKDNNLETQKLWLNSFKIFKKSLEFINFLKNQQIINTSIWEISTIFIQFNENLINCSIQLSFLTKTIWTLKNIDYEIMSENSINYSTLSRLSIYIKQELNNMLSILKTQNDSKWTQYIENLIKYINGYLGILLSIENYKQDKIGYSIGFLNFSIENITRKSNSNEFEEDSKLKKKFTNFKTKFNSNDLQKINNKLRLNQNLIEKFTNNSIILIDLQNLFELLKILNLKYNLENNNLKFDSIPTSQELLIHYLPQGRSIPIDSKIWTPSFIQTIEKSSSGYY
ncbi:hypothetical protein BN7_2364 [Wickerhamomyces ciferrii]|uniref:Uncharacterized protein n=1 Tax=Wickerhamomyces ciferrii (strain ATCC 14091 / BCRC 22168 / CBS 111 / JCM 3599 / NBRC 0793 / NRRL Y-1031 F-60-10) TaxID=1206466 RepID=K0KN87_WICCF|nr:uncharacterized protein BN7_2364 [Wickerhamomyces ciferrii]CCH42819.1 hypothetical protein BN7_2364 [Wickerhamomyces ciferrii]